MAFVNPLFLIALTALAIPVLIHLFNFRRYRKIYFTNVRFLAEIRQETRQRAQLRQLLILLARLLALASLVLAFAQPYLPSKMPQQVRAGRKAVSVYIDNSFSMESFGPEGTLLESAKNKALEIAAAYKPSDLFQLITNDFEGRQQSLVSRDEFRTLVEEVKACPVPRQLSNVLVRQLDALRSIPGRNRDLYLVSDFQRSTADLADLAPDSASNYFLLQMAPKGTANLYVDSAWFDSPVMQPGQPCVLKALVENSGQDAVEKVPVKVLVNGQVKAVASISLEGHSSTTLSLPFTNNDAGIQYGQVGLTDYPVVYDDVLYFSYSLVRSIPVLSINENQPNPYLEAFFSFDSTFVFRDAVVRQLDYSSLPRYSLIILNGLQEISSGLTQELERYIDNGGSLLIFPGLNPDTSSYRTLLASLNLPWYGKADTTNMRVDQVNLQSPVFQDVFERTPQGRTELPENADLPLVSLHFPLVRSGALPFEPLMKLANGDLLLAGGQSGSGKVYLFTTPLDEKATNLPRHLIFVPLLYKIALLSQPFQKLYYFTGQNEPIQIQGDSANDQSPFKIRSNTSGFEVVPEMRNTGTAVLLFPHQQVTEAGLYTIQQDKNPVEGAAFNYDRSESSLSFLSPAEIESAMRQKQVRFYTLLHETKAPITRQINALRQGKPLWKLFIILALLFIAAEIAVIRWMKY